MKKIGISLIVLVITILVLAILVTAVIMSLGNTDIIKQAGDNVEQYNYKSIKESINMAELELYAQDPDIYNKMSPFDKIEYIYFKGLITEKQKNEMIAKGGILGKGNNSISFDTKNVISVTEYENVPAQGKLSIRYKTKLYKPDNIEYTDFGMVINLRNNIEREFIDLPNESKLIIDTDGDFSNTQYIRKNIISSSFDNNKYEISEDGIYKYNSVTSGIPLSASSTEFAVRSYAKYVYKNGDTNIEGIIYSPIYYCKPENAKGYVAQ